MNRSNDTGSPAWKVAIVGYGDEGRDHARRLRAKGHEVVVALRHGGMSWVRAMEDGFRPAQPAEAVRGAHVVAVLVPESEQPALFSQQLAPSLGEGALVVFAHPAAVAARAVDAGRRSDVVLVTADGERCVVAVHADASGRAFKRAAAYALAVYGERAARVLTTTFAEEAIRQLESSADRRGGLAELLANLEQLLDATGHEPDPALVAYYQRLASLANASATLRKASEPAVTTRMRGVA